MISFIALNLSGVIFCWIGAGAVFLDGAELGDGCVVGANAVITKKFPDNVVVAGIPAKVIDARKQ